MYDDDWPFVVFFCGLFLAIVIAVVAACRQGDAKRERFMAQCQQDHKEYECVALWRSGEPKTQLIPVPIVISR